MSDTPNEVPSSRPHEDSAALAHAFEMRHPLLAMAGRLIRRRPVTGIASAALLIVSSLIVIEAGRAGQTVFDGWADTFVYQPILSHQRVSAMAQGARSMEERQLHLGLDAAIKEPMTFYGVDGGTTPPSSLPSDTQAINSGTYADDPSSAIDDPDVFTRDPQHEPAGTTITPLYLADGDLATLGSYVVVWDGRQWGFVPMKEYKAAHLPMQNILQ